MVVRCSSARSGLTMWVMSTSLAATSCSIGVKRKKLSRLTSVISTSCGRAEPSFELTGRVDAAKAAAKNHDASSQSQ